MALRKKKVVKVVEKMTTSMRLPIDLKERIDNAARRSGRSLTQEIEFRLERSFTEESALGGPEMRMLAMEMVATFHNRGARQGRGAKDWMADVEAYTEAMMGVIEVLMRNHPDRKAEHLEEALKNWFGLRKLNPSGFIDEQGKIRS